MTLTFTIPGEPKGNERTGSGKQGQRYTPAMTRAYRDKALLMFRQAAPGWKIHTGPVRLEIVAYYPRAKSHYNNGKLLDTAPIWPLIRPDFDNVSKMVADAIQPKRGKKGQPTVLQGYAYKDDAQIVDSHFLKLYQLNGFQPCVKVSLIFWEQETVTEHAQEKLPCRDLEVYSRMM